MSLCLLKKKHVKFWLQPNAWKLYFFVVEEKQRNFGYREFYYFLKPVITNLFKPKIPDLDLSTEDFIKKDSPDFTSYLRPFM